MKNNIFKGTGVALVTPFNEDYSVDYQSLKKLVEYDLAEGSDFLVVLGTTSEAPTLDNEEKAKVIETVLSVANGRCPILLGLGGNNTRALVADIKTRSFKGIDGILSVVPYYNKPNQTGMRAHFETIADNSPVPVVLYNVPGRVGVNMLATTTLGLAKHPNIIAVKEASGNIQQISEILRDKPAGFDVLSGDDGITQPLVALGAHGVISVAANAYPRLMSDMVRYQMKGETEKALPIHYQIMRMNSLLFADGNPAGVKALLARMGICKNVLRLPLVPANAKVIADIEAEAQQLGLVK